MKHIGITIMLCLCTVMAWAQGRNLELNDVLRGEFTPRNIYGVTPIPGDGEHYSQMNQERTQVIKYSFKTGQQEVKTAYFTRYYMFFPIWDVITLIKSYLCTAIAKALNLSFTLSSLCTRLL